MTAAQQLAAELLASAEQELAAALAHFQEQPTDDAYSQVASAWSLRDAARAVRRLVAGPVRRPKGG